MTDDQVLFQPWYFSVGVSQKFNLLCIISFIFHKTVCYIYYAIMLVANT